MKQFIRLQSTAILFLAAFASATQAQNMSVLEEQPLSLGSTLTLHSQVLGEERKILVSLPDGYAESTERYPVVYMLDAQYYFLYQYTYGVINALHFMETMPEVILVGIHSVDRTRDMAPASATYEGNADNFIRFFREELQPFVEQEYRTQPYRILIGHSAGGLFAVHTLLGAPDTFNAYIALSPAVWFDNASFMNQLDQKLDIEQMYNNFLFTSLATEGSDEKAIYEEFIGSLADEKLDGVMHQFTNYPEESHSSSTLPGIRDGLAAVYRDWVLPESIDNLNSLLSHYQGLSDYFGYDVQVPVKHASDLGFRLVNQGDAEGGLAVFEYRLANIQEDAIAHYSVAFALRSLGRFAEALAAFDRAIAMSASTDDMYPAFIRFRDETATELSAQLSD